MDFKDTVKHAARLKILQLLSQTNGYSLNNEIITSSLTSMGIMLSSAVIRAELQWLSEVGAITIMPVGPLLVAELTERGHDLAKGNSRISGIDQPVPGSGQ